MLRRNLRTDKFGGILKENSAAAGSALPDPILRCRLQAILQVEFARRNARWR